jgi:ATP-dependent DNA helicase RecG
VKQASVPFLNLPVAQLKGIGPKSAQVLSDHGIQSVWDLLRTLPREFEERKHLASISESKTDQTVVLVATLVGTRVIGFGKGRRIDSVLRDSTGTLRLAFFFQGRFHPVFNIKPGTLVTAVGKLVPFQDNLTLLHPKLCVGDRATELAGIWPIYPKSKTLKASSLHRFILSAASNDQASRIEDWVPTDVLNNLELPPAIDAYVNPHLGKISVAALHKSQRRVAFDEMLEFQLTSQRNLRSTPRANGPCIEPISPAKLFSTLHAFEATAAQERVLKEAIADMASGHAMNRLLHGEVGSGKTAIASCLAAHATFAGFQSALMAPTEVLARQHHNTLKDVFASTEKTVALLVSTTSEKDRTSLLKNLAEGKIDILVGTHALLTEDVRFNRLGLVVADEQHRFGVAQLDTLVKKGKSETIFPHVLAMTATPIPRSLALTVYGDMDISVLDELPRGRKPVFTKAYSGHQQQILLKLISDALGNNEKSYVIYPLIDESEKSDLLDAKQGFEELKAHFGEHKILLLHGRMKHQEKEKTLNEFLTSSAKVLVSTTVVEVGVHVPDAIHMIIMHAERFGLAQLHQLRGRVGRGTSHGYCHLLTSQSHKESDACKRLQVLAETQDGFRIAEEDLKIRGPGDIAGTRQSGIDHFQFFRFEKHTDLIEPAKQLSIKIMEQDFTLALEHVQHLVSKKNTPP